MKAVQLASVTGVGVVDGPEPSPGQARSWFASSRPLDLAPSRHLEYLALVFVGYGSITFNSPAKTSTTRGRP